eukprot:UN24096
MALNPGGAPPPGFQPDTTKNSGAPPGFNAMEVETNTKKTEENEDDGAPTKMQVRTLFIVNIPKALKYEQTLEKLCSEFGEVKAVRCPRQKKGKVLKGIGYVEFVEEEACTKAYTGLKGQKLGNKVLRVEKYRQMNNTHVHSRTIYVTGIKRINN